jgi:hypothetical protein
MRVALDCGDQRLSLASTRRSKPGKGRKMFLKVEVCIYEAIISDIRHFTDSWNVHMESGDVLQCVVSHQQFPTSRTYDAEKVSQVVFIRLRDGMRESGELVVWSRFQQRRRPLPFIAADVQV